MRTQRLFGCLLLMLLWIAVASHPLKDNSHPRDLHDAESSSMQHQSDSATDNQDGKIISVRITSSVAVERGRRGHRIRKNQHKTREFNSRHSTERTTRNTDEMHLSAHAVSASEKHSVTVLPPELVGANFEYIKQLRARKEGKSNDHLHPFHRTAFASKSVQEASLDSAIQEDTDQSEVVNVPRARSISLSSPINSIHGNSNSFNSTHENTRNSTTTRVSFNIVHNLPESPKNYNEPEKVYSEPSKIYSEPAKVYGKPEIFYSEPEKVYSEPAKIYGEPAKVYSEPAKIYGEPAKVYGEPEKVYSEPAKVYGEPSKVYSEPAKVYGEPAKIYSEPAKVYAEPAKFYSKPASLNLDTVSSTENPLEITTNSFAAVTSEKKDNEKFSSTNSPVTKHQTEKNFKFDKTSGVQQNEHVDAEKETDEETDPSKDGKVGYVVEGQQFRKYRVEERTPDGFIVGEYGVVSNDDGTLRGVRYTADGDTNPRLIYDALVKFLHLT